MMTAMTGARLAADKNAPMPTNAKARGSWAAAGQTACTAVPNKYPALAPMNSEGVNTPPGAPDPNDAIVASHLHASSPGMSIHATWPERISTTTE